MWLRRHTGGFFCESRLNRLKRQQLPRLSSFAFASRMLNFGHNNSSGEGHRVDVSSRVLVLSRPSANVSPQVPHRHDGKGLNYEEAYDRGCCRVCSRYRIRFGGRSRHQGQADCRAGASGVGSRVRFCDRQRLHLPRHHAVEPQAVGRGVLRAALQHQQGPRSCTSASAAPASASRTAPRPRSTSTAAGVRPSASSRSTSALGTTGIRAASALQQPRHDQTARRAAASSRRLFRTATRSRTT